MYSPVCNETHSTLIHLLYSILSQSLYIVNEPSSFQLNILVDMTDANERL